MKLKLFICCYYHYITTTTTVVVVVVVLLLLIIIIIIIIILFSLFIFLSRFKIHQSFFVCEQLVVITFILNLIS